MKDKNTDNPYYQLKMRIWGQMPGHTSSLAELVRAYNQALKAERIKLSRAQRRRLLKDIIGDMLDELLDNRRR